MTAGSLIGKIEVLGSFSFAGTGPEKYLDREEVFALIRQHEAEHNHGAVARDIDKTREAAKEQRVEVPSAPARTNTLIEEIKTVISVMMHEYFSKGPKQDVSAWVDSFANRLAALHGGGEMRLLNDVLAPAVKFEIADNITIESRSKSDVVQDVWDELVQRGMVREPKREMVTQKPLAEQGCVHCNPIKRNKLLGDPRESVTVKFKP